MWLIKHAAIAAAAGALATGCTASGDEVQPESNQVFFPTGAAVSPDGRRLFVANANSDLTFDSGSIVVVPLDKVNDAITAWTSAAKTIPPGVVLNKDGDATDEPLCEQASDFTETLVCHEQLFLNELRGAGVRIGNFATDIAIQPMHGGNLRLIVPTRGDPSIAWVDWDTAADRLSCTSGGGQFESCDGDHRLSFLLNNEDLTPIPDEPFGVYADSSGNTGFAMVTHLTTGSVTLIDSPPDGGPAQVTDIAQNVFLADAATALRGATGVAGRSRGQDANVVYVGSRSEDRIQTFTVGRPANEAPPFLVSGNWFLLNAVGNESNANNRSNDTRGMAFSPTGDRLYLVNRKPPSLQIIDTSIGLTGFPRNQVVGATDICRQASTITVGDPGDGERVYLSCFQDGQIFVIDPRGRGRVEDIITVGRGPYSVAASPNGQRLYVTNFLEDTIAVVDLTPGSATRNRVVLRIGKPRPL